MRSRRTTSRCCYHLTREAWNSLCSQGWLWTSNPNAFPSKHEPPCLISAVLEMEPRASCMPVKHSRNLFFSVGIWHFPPRSKLWKDSFHFYWSAPRVLKTGLEDSRCSHPGTTLSVDTGQMSTGNNKTLRNNFPSKVTLAFCLLGGVLFCFAVCLFVYSVWFEFLRQDF